MKRRTVLAGVGVGLAGLAGCAQSQEPEPAPTEAPATTSGGTTARTETPTPAQADSGAEDPPAVDASPLRLLSVAAPTRVEIATNVGYQFTVENPAREPHVYEPATSVRDGTAGWSTLDRWEPVELAAGEVRTFKSSSVTSEYLTTKVVRVDGIGATFGIEFVERRVPFGGTYTDPVDREVVVDGVNVRDSFEYTSDGYERMAEAGGDHQWAMLDVRVMNRVNESIEAPPYDGFSLVHGEETYQPLPTEHDDAYTPVELPRNGGASGVILFKVPEHLASRDVGASWYASFDGGDVGAVWSPR